MSAHSHAFILPYLPWPENIEAGVSAIEAKYQLDAWARRIRDQGPHDALKICLRDDEAAEWSYRAGQYLDSDGDDDGDFAGMIADLDRQLNPCGYGPADEDAGFRESAYAEQHLRNMDQDRRAMLERDWS